MNDVHSNKSKTSNWKKWALIIFIVVAVTVIGLSWYDILTSPLNTHSGEAFDFIDANGNVIHVPEGADIQLTTDNP